MAVFQSSKFPCDDGDTNISDLKAQTTMALRLAIEQSLSKKRHFATLAINSKAKQDRPPPAC
jgi:hypothetical protein